MAKDIYRNINGLTDGLLNGELSGKLPIEDFKTLISELKEFTRQANEGTEAYKRMLEAGERPTRKQIKEYKQLRAESDKLRQAWKKASTQQGYRAGTSKKRTGMLAKGLEDAMEASNRKAGWSHRFTENKDAKRVRENSDYVKQQREREKEQERKDAEWQRKVYLQNNPRAVKRLNNERNKHPLSDIEKTFGEYNKEKPKAKEATTAVTPDASKLEKEAEERVKKAEENLKKQTTTQQYKGIMPDTMHLKGQDMPFWASNEATRELQKRDIENAKKEVADAKKELADLQSGKSTVIPDASQQKNGKEVLPAEQVKAQSESIVESCNKTKEAIQGAVSSPTNATSGAEAIANLEKELESLKGQEGAKERVQEIIGLLNQLYLARKQISSSTQQDSGLSPSTEKTAIDKEIEEKKAELEQLRREFGKSLKLNPDFKPQFIGDDKGKFAYDEDIKQKLDVARKELAELIATKKQIEGANKEPTKTSTTATDSSKALGGVADSTKNVENQSNKTTSSLKNLDRELKQKKTDADDASSAFSRFGDALKNAISTIASLAKTIASIGKKVWSGLTDGVKEAVSGIKNLAKSISSLVSGGFNLLKSAASTTLGNMQRLASGGFNAIKNGANIAKKSFSGIKNAMHQIVKKSTPNMMRSLTSLKSMLMRRIKRTFISSIFNQAKEGLQELAKSSNDFNQSMSNIKNMASQVSGNLAITLGNLIQTVEPVLMKILNFINSIFAAVNGLFAMISGKSTMLVAKKGTDDYAKSLKKAGGAAKDLNHQLYGFDEITRQEDNSGGGGGGGKIGYEEQDIGNALGSWSDFFKEMLEAFKSGQFEKVGQLVAKQLTSVTKKINDWVKKLRPQATKWSSNIARILNGMLDPEMFKAFGELFASGINLAFDVVNTFFETFHFDELGECLAEGLNKMFGDIEWELVGTTIINYFNSIWQTLGNFFESLNWEDIGHNLAIAVYAIFDNIDWESFKQMWSEGINGVFKLLYTFFADIDWGKIASDFVTNFVDLIQNRIDWGMIKNALSSMLLSILDVFHVLVSSDFFINLATRLGEVVNGILNDVNWEQLAADIIIGLAKLRTAFWSFIGELDIPTLATKLANAINGLFTNEEVQKAIEESKKKVKEGIDKIIKGFRNLVDPNEGINFGEIGSTIGKEVGDLLKDVDWTTLAESIGLGVSGLVEAFGKLLTGLDLPNVAIKISEGINALFDPQKGGAKFDDAINAVSEGVNSLIDGFANLIDPQNGIKFDSIASTLAEKVNGLIKRVDWSKLISTFVLLKIDLYNALFKAIGEIDWETLGSKIATSINDLFTSDRLASLGENIGKALTSVLEGITSLIADIKWDEVAKGIVEFIKNIKWADVLTAIVNCLTAAVVGVGDLLQGFWTAIFGGGSENVEVPQVLSDNIMQQLKDQMGEAGKELANTLTNAIVENLQGAGSNYEDAKMLFINSMALIGQGGQEEFESTMKEWNINEATTAALAQNVGELYEALGAPNATLQSVQEKFHENGIYITNGLAEALIGQGSENIATAMQLLAMGVDEDTIAALDLSHLNENLTNYMNETGTDITTIAGALGADVGKEIGDKIPEAVKDALSKGKKEVKETADEVVKEADTSAQQATAKANATATGEAVATNIGKAEEDNAYKVENGADTIKKSIDGKISELPEEEKKQATKMMDYIIKGIEEGDPLVKTAINSAAQAMIDKFKEILNSTQGIQIAKDFINGMWSTFNTDTSVVNSMQHIAKTTRNTAMIYLNATNGMTIGGNMIIGMINGMNAYGTMLVMTIAKICNVSVQTARDILGIKSPSKVFAEIGEYTMEGMQIGLENEGKNAVNTVANLAKEITSEGEGTTFGVMSNGLDTVADKLTRIANVFSDIADVITQMGGSLQIPTIAAGQTIPYRTQLGANGGSFSNGEALDATAIENAFYSAITRAMGNSDNSQNINVYLDGRQIADSVTKYQRRQARAMGV